MKKIHLIVSEFNNPIPEQLLQGALRALKDAKFPDKDIIITRVPGAFELPLAAFTAGQRALTAAVVCLGAVIRGIRVTTIMCVQKRHEGSWMSV